MRLAVAVYGLLFFWAEAFAPITTRESPLTRISNSHTVIHLNPAELSSTLFSDMVPPTVIRSVELGGGPAVGMLIATVFGLRVPTPPSVVGALQHFAAGILLTTVAKELLPEMVRAEGLVENLASGAGFFGGVGVLILLGILFPEAEEAQHPEAVASTKTSLRNKKQSRKASAFALSSNVDLRKEVAVDDEMRQGWYGDDTITMGSELDNFSASSVAFEAVRKEGKEQSSVDPVNPKTLSFAPLPVALLAAVSVDAALDGLLIGTSTALDPSTGPILSASLAVESTFLGLTIATALRACSPSQGWTGATFAPVSLLTAATAGGFLAPALTASPALLAGILGFGTSATLFMVAEELLLEAHEDGGEHVWWVDLQLYTGFFASVMVEKFVVMG